MISERTPEGRAKRAPTFLATLDRQFIGTELSSAAITDLVLSAGDMGLPPAAHRTLLFLVHKTHSENWRAARPIYRGTNERIGRCLNIDERTVRVHLAQLERSGWIVRRYTERNQRIGTGGIDLSPLGARLEELAMRADGIDQDIADRRLEDAKTRQKNPPGWNRESTHTSSDISPSPRGVQASGMEVRRDGSAPPPRPSGYKRPEIDERATPPRDAVHARQILTRLLPELGAGLGHLADGPDVTAADLAAAADTIAASIGIPRADLSAGRHGHGPATYAAIIVAAASDPRVRDPVAYARVMLRTPRDGINIWASIYKLGRKTKSADLAEGLVGQDLRSAAPPLPRPDDVVRSRIYDIVGAGAYRSWFDQAEVEIADRVLTISVNSAFAADEIHKRYRDELEARLSLAVRAVKKGSTGG